MTSGEHARRLEARLPSVDELMDSWEQAWSAKQRDAFTDVCSPEVHYEDPLVAEPLEGPAAVADHAERLWAAFPDARLQKLGSRLTDGRFVAAPTKLLATHREPLGGVPATNKFIVVPAVFYCEVEHGKLLRVRAFFDVYGAAVQLGLLPGRGTLGEKALLMLRGFGLRTGHDEPLTSRMSIDVAIPIFDEFTALDAVGPYEVLSRLPGATVSFVAIDPGPKRTENGMLALIADRALVDLPHPEVVVVPGGFGTRALLGEERILTWLREAHAHSTWTTSVCTGSLLLAAAGILEGLEATTHWLAMDELAEQGVTPVSRRIVEQGKVLTAAGVSAGIDMALLLASRIAGEELARAIQLGIEYDPDPPFPGGSLETSPPEIVELVRRHAELA